MSKKAPEGMRARFANRCRCSGSAEHEAARSLCRQTREAGADPVLARRTASLSRRATGMSKKAPEGMRARFANRCRCSGSAKHEAARSLCRQTREAGADPVLARRTASLSRRATGMSKKAPEGMRARFANRCRCSGSAEHEAARSLCRQTREAGADPVLARSALLY
ncbi:hypothetical protein EI53_00419 [Fusobacterium naviforme]|nr:hypothetical protein EI53_00419 [Fusobacterium naviforme]